jgi:hypothetical protein
MWWDKLLTRKPTPLGFLETAEQRLNASSRAIEEIVREASDSISGFRQTSNRIDEFLSDRDDADDKREKAQKVASEKLRSSRLD